MGGDLLWRKNITMKNKKFRAVMGKLFFLLFAFAVIIPAAAQPEGERQIGEQPDTAASAEYFPNLPENSNSLITDAVLEHSLTQRYIAHFSSENGVKFLNAALERGSIYLPFIRKEIAERNLPPELAYLPIIESGFHVTARSRSGAVGLWQFMLNSISGYGIKVNDTVDERRDFIKSTKGALQKLEDNYAALGSWELALAAYNAGLGAVTRIIQRTKINDYWELSRKGEFKQETLHYVPKLIAAAYVLSKPEIVDIEVWNKPFEWKAVPLARQVSLDIVAEEAGIEKDILKRLNAHLLYGITPAVSGYQLIVPADYVEQISSVLEREDLKLIRYYYHIVRQGDTLWSMSKHYGISLNMIEQHNPGILNRYLKIGETVIVPAFNDIAPPSRQIVTKAFDGTHLVKNGETFWSLSMYYKVDPQSLAEANGMTIDQILRAGRTLKVPIIE